MTITITEPAAVSQSVLRRRRSSLTSELALDDEISLFIADADETGLARHQTKLETYDVSPSCANDTYLYQDNDGITLKKTKSTVNRLAIAIALVMHFFYTSSQSIRSPRDLSIRMRRIYESAFPSSLHNVSSYDNLLHRVNLDIPVPKNLNIVFMGDSLTRYQYIDLVYFLSHGHWVGPEDRPNMVIEKTHADWNSFYNYTNMQIQPFENCDCFRKGGRINHDLSVENRYFVDTKNNNRATFLQKFGGHPFKTSWPVSEILSPHELVKHQENVSMINKWNWIDTIKNFACKMEPKPSVFIFNSGLWPDSELSNTDMHNQTISALKNCGITSVYKTTTATNSDSYDVPDNGRERLCTLADMCLNVSWTELVPGEKYWDGGHFIPPIYSLLNVHLLSLLASSSLDVDMFT